MDYMQLLHQWLMDFADDMETIEDLESIEDDPKEPAFITTVWGFGYKWSDGTSKDEDEP